LDADSEGLLLLSDEPEWNARLLSPGRHVKKTYWALVERLPSTEALAQLESGIPLDGKLTLPANARILDPQPVVPPRDPPVRIRKSVSDFWIELQIHEGRNRQVRRMTAAVGHPTIRLLRVAIGNFSLGNLPCGSSRKMTTDELLLLAAG
jgi:23S rRNA pseudouridine2457 synthase